MILTGEEVISKFAKKHTDARKWLEAWIATVADAAWQSLEDVRADFASADGVKLKTLVVVTIFNVKGNEYRLLTFINFTSQTVRVLDVMTHAEYDKNKWKERY